ncbi:hypothetical protein D3C72_2361790 [compost metagenome]
MIGEKHGDHRRQCAAQRHAGIHDADRGAATLLTHGLGTQSNQIGQGRAQA